MRATTVILLGTTILLAACADKPGDKTGDIAATDAMSKAEVKAEVDKVQLKPGQWEGRFTIQDIAMPNAPAGMTDQMKHAMSQTALKYCVTPEQAANPSGAMFSGQDNPDCTYGGFQAAGGVVKGQVSCKPRTGAGGTMNATMSGTYAAEQYSMEMDMKMEGGPQAMAMTARSEGKWIGPDCAPGQ